MRASLNPHIETLSLPPIPEAQSWTRAYDGAHGPLINLSQAVPGTPPHADLLERLARAAGSADAARYGMIEGDLALRQAYAAETAKQYGADLDAGHVAITAGCNEAFAVAAMLAAQAGDEVILPTPWYFNHQTTLAMLGITPVALPARAQNGFVPDPADARALITPRTRAIALVTPNNPTGAIYPPETLAAFTALAREEGLWLILDETYRDFLAGDGAPHALFDAPDWGDNLIALYSFSKSYAVPGHRLGAMIAGSQAMEGIVKILDNLQICPARTGQIALAWAIPNLRQWRAENRADILMRAGIFTDVIARHPGWKVESIGAYFAYLRHPWPGTPAAAIAERLARERGVLALPGSYFGPDQEDFLRVAFANVESAQVAALDARLADM
ncbi:MAG: aminotransferase [Salinarimonas sp.]